MDFGAKSFWLAMFLIVSLPLSADLPIENKLTALRNSITHLDSLMTELERGSGDSPSMCFGRLTLRTGEPVPTTDTSSGSTLYYSPYKGSRIGLWDGSKWVYKTFSEISLALSGLSTANYDVFAYNNSGTVALELSAAWSTDTARTDELDKRNGIYIKSTDHTRRYLGTIRSTGATTTVDSASQRYVWNYYHRVRRIMVVNEGTDSWNYTTTNTWRPYFNSASNRVQYVAGIADYVLYAVALSRITGNSTWECEVGLGIDSTTTNSMVVFGGSQTSSSFPARALFLGAPSTAIGFHYLQMLEAATGPGCTFYGDAGDNTQTKSGLLVLIDG